MWLGISVLCLAGCGGGGSGGGVVSNQIINTWTTVSTFSDGRGVGRVETSDGVEAMFILPNIVDLVANANAENSGYSNDDLNDYPVVSQSQGYNLRQGTISGMNVIFIDKIGNDKAQIEYLATGIGDAIAAYPSQVGTLPSGSHTFSGIYTVGTKDSSFFETGPFSATADFGAGTFTLTASSTDTTLSGNGFINLTNGRISSGILSFTDVDAGNYTASAYGNVGGEQGTELTGVWHTNDTAVSFQGAFAGER